MVVERNWHGLREHNALATNPSQILLLSASHHARGYNNPLRPYGCGAFARSDGRRVEPLVQLLETAKSCAHSVQIDSSRRTPYNACAQMKANVGITRICILAQSTMTAASTWRRTITTHVHAALHTDTADCS